MKAIYKRVWPYQKDAMALPVANVEEAIPFYEKYLGFTVEKRATSPCVSAVLVRGEIRIGLAENGGDSSQDGCFFETDNIEAEFAEISAKGWQLGEPNFRVDKYGETSYRVFFVVAPDGLCFCIGEKIN